ATPHTTEAPSRSWGPLFGGRSADAGAALEEVQQGPVELAQDGLLRHRLGQDPQVDAVPHLVACGHVVGAHEGLGSDGALDQLHIPPTPDSLRQGDHLHTLDLHPAGGGCRRLLSAAAPPRGPAAPALMLAELPPPPDCGLCQTTGTLPVAPAASTVAAAVAIVLWYVEDGAPLTLLLFSVGPGMKRRPRTRRPATTVDVAQRTRPSVCRGRGVARALTP